MNDVIRRNTALTVAGLSVTAAVFIFAIFLPGKRASQQVHDEIAQAEAAIRNIPNRLAEIESLRRDIRRRQEYLEAAAECMPSHPHLHEVLHHVSALAKQAEFQVTRLEPLPPVKHESFQEFAFRLSGRGSFHGLTRFTYSLEQQSRLFHVKEFRITRESREPAATAEGDIYFSVYSGHGNLADSTEIRRSVEGIVADRKTQ